ncbi:MAG: hypothetical protein COW00_14745 [Bdellovibrio sp. CG12_big_fil_rev_8_21_14_0_65_39_13]|nr:MAG: hypothetical protein COW78_14005 [Bdellovibrio sp. CG22_combo_CG10-13_8_21_14_all_39_27]PIQ58553.1 MAG: hypothetical protein COW00_14745 [Bdellovibrio sp. CG12_big_fil_rev_8_21_14_0_65_39_13]PIR32464.1 MAG: hypothetical protein COV37_19860 [Bdellovibrio sp. CG11_big_fil_rev_8_21_14_0_20_39_38]
MKLLTLFSVIYLLTSVDSFASLKFNLGQGYSNNISKNKTEHLKGQFLDSDLSVDTKIQPINTIATFSFINRHYKDEVYADNFDSSVFSFDTISDFLLKQNTIFIGGIHGERFDGRGIDFDNNSVLGRDELYSIYAINGGITQTHKYEKIDLLFGFDLELGYKRFDTLSNDENGNLFRDDQDGFTQKVWALIKNRKGDDVKVTAFHSKTAFHERRSRFTEGTLDNSRRNPFQELEIWKVSIQYEKKFDFFDLQFIGESDIQDDLIFGALDSKQNSLALSFTFDFFDLLILRPSMSFSNRKFQTFVADLINNPSATEKRKDRSFVQSVNFEVPYKNLRFTINLQNTKNDSNYQLEGYHEHSFGFGLGIHF